MPNMQQNLPSIQRVGLEHDGDGLTLQVHLDTGDIIDVSIMTIDAPTIVVTTTLATLTTISITEAQRCPVCNQLLIDNTCYTNNCSNAPLEDH